MARHVGASAVLLSVALLFVGLSGGGIWPAKAAACDHFLTTVIFVITGGIFFTGVVICCSEEDNWCILCPAGCLKMLFVLLLLAIGIFAFAVSKDGGAQSVVGSGYKQFDLDGYSTWLRHRVRNEAVWKSIKGCIMKREECQQLLHARPDKTTRVVKFNDLQSGCCKPPDICRFTVINQSESTYAPPPDASSSSLSDALDRDPDCRRFVVDGDEKCFECDSCRAAFLETLRRRWRIVAMISIPIAGMLICGGGEEARKRQSFEQNRLRG
ncbi:hypothetical protein CBR_g40080 [Chara braunii]|uniref:Uncharacterized protein n=1 Tax=Chara braunii TaxID=69332 RepID=A0A388LSY3_CHABU|nr:hypothetical protein CBR_g40080 [Chara braunii]|eukprot:GBG85438.1 hypothetical protein CBR_g40080 [Chara braunii]